MKLYQRDPIYRCWRVAAIYRCVIRYGKPFDWAIEEMRRLYPDHSRDAVVENWFVDIDRIRVRVPAGPEIEEPRMAA